MELSPLKIGDIYWLNDCPPLDGGVSARRPVVVIDGGDPCIVVGVTTSGGDDPDHIDLPNLRMSPGTSTGLPQPCAAIPRWIIHADRKRLVERLGTLPIATLDRLVAAMEGLGEL